MLIHQFCINTFFYLEITLFNIRNFSSFNYGGFIAHVVFIAGTLVYFQIFLYYQSIRLSERFSDHIKSDDWGSTVLTNRK